QGCRSNEEMRAKRNMVPKGGSDPAAGEAHAGEVEVLSLHSPTDGAWRMVGAPGLGTPALPLPSSGTWRLKGPWVSCRGGETIVPPSPWGPGWLLTHKASPAPPPSVNLSKP
uniref:Uncharacterized protein n=1 Tax=Gopherus evgoodei TaxID=1825980 RepID=A0A8C4VM82_9SAUR